MGLVDWRHWCVLPPLVGLGKCSGELEGSWELSVKTFAAIIYFGNGIYLHLKIRFLKNAWLRGEFVALHQAVVAADFE